MAGKQQNNHRTLPRFRSKTLILTLIISSFSLLVILFTFPSSPNPPVRIETSFVASLEQFLIHKAPKLNPPLRDDTVRGEKEDDDVRKVDEMVFERENRLLDEDPVGYPVKVYVYEMPKKFTFDLLWLFHNTYKETSNATSNGSPVHRLIEQVLLITRTKLYWSWSFGWLLFYNCSILLIIGSGLIWSLLNPSGVWKVSWRFISRRKQTYSMFRFSPQSASSCWRSSNAKHSTGCEWALIIICYTNK